MDADDISEPKRFAEQLTVLKETEADIVGSHLAEFYDDPEQPERTRKVPTSHDEIAEWMPWRCPMNHPTTMFDREAVLNAGGYRDFPMMEDWDLWARCLAAGLQFRNLDQTLVRAQIDELVDRRGGLDYAKAELRMARELRELGIATHQDTLQHLCLRIPPRLLPPVVRNVIYHLFAR
ncbi:putative glycosyltransferase [Haloarcula hispanica ATCC 33960]|nr:putative glycosyltransferase [Haloarcula hispanica ATCC 33960]